MREIEIKTLNSVYHVKETPDHKVILSGGKLEGEGTKGIFVTDVMVGERPLFLAEEEYRFKGYSEVRDRDTCIMLSQVQEIRKIQETA